MNWGLNSWSGELVWDESLASVTPQKGQNLCGDIARLLCVQNLIYSCLGSPEKKCVFISLLNSN